MTVYLLLIYEFFKIGLFSVGGGLATLPFLYDLASKDYGWFSAQSLADMLAVSESTPGPMGVNMATYAGFHAGGILGGIVATLALAVPGIVIIIIIYKFLEKFKDNKYVNGVFYALHPAVGALITLAVLQVYQTSFLTEETPYILPLHFVVFAVLLVGKLLLNKKKKLHPVLIIVIGAVLGAALGL